MSQLSALAYDTKEYFLPEINISLMCKKEIPYYYEVLYSTRIRKDVYVISRLESSKVCM